MSGTLDEAKKNFLTLMNKLSEKDIEEFQTFVFEKFIKDEQKFGSENSDQRITDDDNVMEDPVYLLNAIATEIKSMIPSDAIFPSEKMLSPKTGENSDCLPDVTIHVDEFLYNEEDVDKRIEQGELQSHYCRSCGSKNTEPLIFISHSMSKEALYYIFNTKLPRLDNKVVLDVGSRLGAVLYGAYAYTDAKRIIGVEMNDDFCKLQNSIISKHNLQDRVEIVHDRIENVPWIVSSADVIVLNNAFEFYLPPSEQVKVWNFLKNKIQKGAILVTRPHLETTFKNIPTGIEINSWLKPYDSPEQRMPFDDEEENSAFCDFAFYQVL